MMAAFWVFCLILWIQCFFFPLTPNFYSLSLFFSTFIIVWPDVVFFVFILLEFHWSSWINRFIVLKKIWSLFLQLFSKSFSSCPLIWDFSCIHIRLWHCPLKLCFGLCDVHRCAYKFIDLSFCSAHSVRFLFLDIILSALNIPSDSFFYIFQFFLHYVHAFL